MKSGKYLSAISMLLCTLALILRQYLVNAATAVTLLCIAALLCGVAVDVREKRFLPAGICAAAIVFGAVRLLGGVYLFNILFAVAAVLWQISEIAVHIPAIRSKRRLGILAAACVLLLLGSSLALADVISADLYIRLMQSPLSFHVSNSFDAAAAQEIPLENGGTYFSNVSYGSKYPNGYLDIYISEQNGDEPCPTFLFVHGGGFTWGDKVDGDPNGGEGGGQQWYFSELLKAGYNIVSVNYALAPEYRYPTPILQLCEATEFLNGHAAEYGLDMTCTVYSGGSAGGSVVGQFVCAQTDSGYAAQTGVPQVISPERIKAVVFASALLDGARYYTTGSVGFDFMLNECGRVYWGEDFASSEVIPYTDIVQCATGAFPPTYISDGNHGSFTDQAKDLYDKLTGLGVSAEFTFYSQDIEALGHGFEIFNTPCGADNLQRTIAFLNENAKAG